MSHLAMTPAWTLAGNSKLRAVLRHRSFLIMISKGYKDYLRSAKWQKKREQVFRFYGKKCYACGTRQGPFHVHHLDYRNLGNEPLADLMPLCMSCHREVTVIYKRNRRRGLRRVTLEYVQKMRNKKTKRASP